MRAPAAFAGTPRKTRRREEGTGEGTAGEEQQERNGRRGTAGEEQQARERQAKNGRRGTDRRKKDRQEEARRRIGFEDRPRL